MPQIDIQKRIEKLRAEIRRLRNLYHQDNAPEVTDEVYDSLTRELKILLQKYPEFIDSNAPENRVAGKALDKFQKVKHKTRMLSLNDAFSYEELYEWEKRIKKLTSPNPPLTGEGKGGVYFCEVKFDGLAVSLIYENGKFIRGATRGDGYIGEDITENLKMIDSIPLNLTDFVKNSAEDFAEVGLPQSFEVRGEVVMRKDIFEKLNKKQEKEGKIIFANTRNVAAGSLRQLDPELVKERKLDFFAYDLIFEKSTEKNIKINRENTEALPMYIGKASVLKTHSEKHKFLRNLGFNVEKNEANCTNLKEVESFIKKFEKIRMNFSYGTDGIVISVNDLKLQEILGVVGKAPRYMTAFKYPAERATTILKDIIVNVGRTGVITPIAVFRPVKVAGSLISKATLHNMDQIERLDLRIGDTVVIEKAGDVIPKVKEVLIRMRTGKEFKFKMPKNCPICEYPLQKKILNLKNEKSVGYFCINKKCSAKDERYLEHFVSVFGIYELGPKILKRFKDQGLINDPADIWTLSKEDIAGLSQFGEKSASNIIKEIENKKKISFAKFLWALGILNVGEETAKDIAMHFISLDKLLNTRQDLVLFLDNIENIGEVVSKNIYDFFNDKSNLHFIEKLKRNGVIIEDVYHKKKGKFTGKIFVLTGVLKGMSRQIAKEKIIDLGGKVASSVSKNTSFVVAGEESGNKLKEAQKLGIKILSEEEFLKVI